MSTSVSLASAGASYPVNSPSDRDPFGSKIGGSPAWFDTAEASVADLMCPVCCKSLVLVTQLYAPDVGPRSLLLFACLRFECVTNPSCWRCVRSQKVEPVPAETVPDPVAKAASGWDVDEDCEGWGDGGGWGCIVETAPAAAFGAFAAPKSSEDAVDTGLPDISSLSVADCEHVPALVPVSLEWYDEPPGRSDALDAKARALLDKYLKEGEPEEVESLRISLIGGRVLSPCGDSGHSEGHERLSATDKCALKFQDTIARAPTQCVRYAFQGEPLWPTPPPPAKELQSAVPKCRCGETRVFECQVLPTVINYLQPNPALLSAGLTHEIIEDLDWDVLLVFSCPNSCESSREEVVFVR